MITLCKCLCLCVYLCAHTMHINAHTPSFSSKDGNLIPKVLSEKNDNFELSSSYHKTYRRIFPILLFEYSEMAQGGYDIYLGQGKRKIQRITSLSFETTSKSSRLERKKHTLISKYHELHSNL